MADYLGYSNKICVVTGASSGIGRETAKMLVDLGADVYALCRRDPKIDGIKQWVSVDLLSKEQIDKAFSELPSTIDCFFGIAGIASAKVNYVDTITMNFIANRYMIETYLDTRLRDGGCIACVSSPCCRCWPERQEEYMSFLSAKDWDSMVEAAAEQAKTIPGSLAYIASKRAINYYAAAQVAHFAKRDIRFNIMIPTATKSEMMAMGIEDMGNDSVYQTYMCNDKPYASPASMAKGLIYLNSELAEYVSGLELYADWGFEAAVRVGQRPDDKGTPIQVMMQYSG